MNLTPRLENLTEKKLVGMPKQMSFSNNTTRELWGQFMPYQQQVQNRIGTDFYSLEIYPASYFLAFSPHVEFEKWAAVKVDGFGNIPPGMQVLTVPGGLYAVFLHKGAASEGAKTYQYIFGTWLPDSSFLLDNRPHFALMGKNYKHEHPQSEEEIWVPVKPKVSRLNDGYNG